MSKGTLTAMKLIHNTYKTNQIKSVAAKGKHSSLLTKVFSHMQGILYAVTEEDFLYV